MSNVVELNNYKDMTPRFTLEATMDANGGWDVQIVEFYDDRMPSHAVFREVAAALVPIAGGMIHSAETLEPTKHGCIVSNIAIYNSGHIEFHTQPLDTDERKAWLAVALDTIKNMACGLDK